MAKSNSSELIQYYPIRDLVLRCYNEIKKDQKGRDQSWEHCFSAFQNAFQNNDPDIDYLSLHLGFYLASWGMMRGSTGLFWKDYKVHHEIVKILINPDYNSIRCTVANDFYPKDLKLIFENLVPKLQKAYSDQSYFKTDNDKPDKINPSEILISKILLGTLCCVPAYDTNIKGALKKIGIIQTFNVKSISQLYDALLKGGNFENLQLAQKEVNNDGNKFPLMRIIDMYLWEVAKKKKLKQQYETTN